ncbi:hypothetical protein BKI49_17545 [Streptomyces sp. Tue6028]|uniref:hypothetical protein n=1 Tax=Streptomyces sp. Tue6028 TaxID=2036037 RepID=UPI000BCFBEDC|nr:hypothetical protein [Streptomyces sp. Tue6028]PBC62633.1 hypothetical protein BKI49_17545 [Streptomyces sp. Tue6028]
MSRDEATVVRDTELEKYRARYGLLSVVISNLAIAGVAVFGVWRLDGDKAVIVGVLTSAFTAVSSMTTAYLGIKAISNTARSMAPGAGPAGHRRESAPTREPAPAAPAAAAPEPPAQRAP